VSAAAFAALSLLGAGTASAQDATTTTLSLETGDTTPNRIDAGAGGTAADSGVPVELTVLATGLAGCTFIGIRKARRA
jgi:hypothetical protein